MKSCKAYKGGNISLVFSNDRRILPILYIFANFWPNFPMHTIVFEHLRKDINTILEEKTNDGQLILTFSTLWMRKELAKFSPNLLSFSSRLSAAKTLANSFSTLKKKLLTPENWAISMPQL